jgi:geranylgeranyl pyrophosphate synthase
MREVVAIMAADRILAELLGQAVADGTVTDEEAAQLSARSLQALLGSAGQEASEEAGVEDRPRPEKVLQTIHRLKTGLLFHIPFVGPDVTGEGNTPLAGELKTALLDFGLGCQLLDDIRDLATDLVERRHNYLLSHLRWHAAPTYDALIARQDCRPGDRLYQEFPDVARLVAVQAYEMMRASIATVSNHGLALRRGDPVRIARSMFRVLDLADLAEAIDG